MKNNLKPVHISKNLLTIFKAKATKAKQAQSRIKQLERMQDFSRTCRYAIYLFSFREPTPNELTTQMEHVDIGYGDKLIATNVNLQFPKQSYWFTGNEWCW